MIQAGCRLRFVTEALAQLRSDQSGPVRDFECDESAQGRIGGEEDDAKSALPQGAANLKATEFGERERTDSGVDSLRAGGWALPGRLGPDRNIRNDSPPFE